MAAAGNKRMPPTTLAEELEPDFAVLMPTHNREDMAQMFDQAIDSIYTNNLQPKQVVVVVDGKLDPKFEANVKSRQAELGFTTIWLEENQGITTALNIGLEAITCRYTFRADGDDINLPTRFERLYSKLQEGYDLVGSWIIEQDKQGNPMHTRRVPKTGFAIKIMAPFRNPFNHMSMGFSTEFAKRVGGYPELYLREDYGLWVKMLSQQARATNIQDPLVLATTGSGLHIRRSGAKYVMAEYQLQKYLLKTRTTLLPIAIFAGILRSLAFSLPLWAHHFIYRYFLRDQTTRISH